MDAIRDALARLLDWEDAHVGFDAVVAGLSPALRAERPAGLPHSAWQLVEHLRLAQHDILEFCVNPAYQAPTWPDDYWPVSPAPASDEAWEASLAAYRADRDALKDLARNARIDLLAQVRGGDGQTFLRELLLVADHTAYHVGQIVLLRRALGAWPPAAS